MATGDASRRPDWLTEACPDWCIGEHEEHDHLEDRWHVSREARVPGLRLVERGGTAINDVDEPREIAGLSIASASLHVVLTARVGVPVTWVYIGDGSRHGLTISRETVVVLAEVLRSVVGM